MSGQVWRTLNAQVMGLGADLLREPVAATGATGRRGCSAEKEQPAGEALAEARTAGKLGTGSSRRRSAGPWEEELPTPHAACPRQCVHVKAARPVNVLTSTFLSPSAPRAVLRGAAGRRAGLGLF